MDNAETTADEEMEPRFKGDSGKVTDLNAADQGMLPRSKGDGDKGKKIAKTMNTEGGIDMQDSYWGDYSIVSEGEVEGSWEVDGFSLTEEIENEETEDNIAVRQEGRVRETVDSIHEVAGNENQIDHTHNDITLGAEASKQPVLTTLSYKKRKRGREGPDSCLEAPGISAVERAIQSAGERPGEPIFYPYVGTTFASFEAAKEFYNLYSWEIGFGIRESRTKTNSNNYTTRKDMVCSCEGFCRNKRAASVRTGCKAMLRLHRTENHSWIVSKIISEHNHPLSLSFGEKKQWGSHSFVDPVTKQFIERLRRNNIPIGRLCSVVGVFSPTNELSIRKQTVKALCARIAQEDIKDDIRKTVNILHKMKEEDNELEVRFKTNNNGQIEAMLWCTGKNKRDFSKFGDVVTFDTTYRTNLYNLPFGIFVGVNSHYQSIIFGGVLLTHERTEDFEWTFSNFIEIIGGKQPQTILTDQCQGMAAAIKSTMKGTRHRWCRWHVLRNGKQKIGSPYSRKSGFKKSFNKLITEEISPSAFERKWQELVIEYKLEDNKFMTRAYRIRGMWAKPYFMDIFCAGMTSTQRSESANHMLKRLIQRSAPMHIFVTKFSEFQFDRNQEEERENHLTRQQTRRRRIGVPIERHAETIYTREMHERFYKELYKAGSYKIVDKSANEKRFTMTHIKDVGEEDPRLFIVHVIEEDKLICSCGLFEHMGMPCRHILKVLMHLDIPEIPKGNIHARWTKIMEDKQTEIQAETIISQVSKQSNELKRRVLIMKALELSQSKEPIDDNAFSEAVRAMDGLLPKCQGQGKEVVKESTQERKGICSAESSLQLSLPPRPKRTGRPRDTSLKSWKKHSKLEKDTRRSDEEKENEVQNIEDQAKQGKTRKLCDLLQVT